MEILFSFVIFEISKSKIKIGFFGESVNKLQDDQ